MFESLLSRIDSTVAHRIFRVQINIPQPVQRRTIEKSSSDTEMSSSLRGGAPTRQSIKNINKLGRNDPCWCGSGKKWKACHYPKLG